jgi:Domain of unknown function (DUF4365)
MKPETSMAETRPIRDTPTNRRQLALIRKSALFNRRQKLISLLDYLASETMAGREAELTQKRIAKDVFKFANAADDQAGVTVRTAATRLRTALLEYYRTIAAPGEIVVTMPSRRFYIATETPAASTTTQSSPEDLEAGPSAPVGKQIKQTDVTGQQGINLIERICLEMGYLWRPTGLDAGIDGHIEIRLPTGEVTNCIIQVQSKATDRPFEAETSSSLEFRCSQRDLDYWLGGNAPVILVRSRPRTNEAYWVSVKDYFSDLSRRKTGKIAFDKTLNRFDATAKSALQQLAMRDDAGLYLATQPKREIIYSNLLRLAPLPDTYYVAATEYRTSSELFARLHELTRPVHGEWILHDRMLWSFHDLSARPWTEVIDPGTLESHAADEWAQTDEPVRQRQFVQLLNTCLKEKLFRKGVKFSRETGCYYFRASQDLSNIEYFYASREHKTSRTVFKGYPKKFDRSQMSYYRHSAFEGRFVCYGGMWCLQITPTYHFTRDGERLSRYAPDLLSGIKRLENNQAVHGQVVMWAHLLTSRSLFDSGPQFLDFAALQQFELGVGLDDDTWIRREDVDMQAALDGPNIDEQQVSFML